MAARFYSLRQFPAADQAWAKSLPVEYVRGFGYFRAVCPRCDDHPSLEFRHVHKYDLQVRLAEHAVLHVKESAS